MPERGVMFNLKMEPRWHSEIGQVMHSNAKEEKILKRQITRINNAKREQLGKIEREMITLRKQLLEDRKILGTRSDIRKREDKNANILEGNGEDKQVNIVQPKLTGFQKHDTVDRNCFKPFEERSRHKAFEQSERKWSPSKFVSTAQEGNSCFRKRMPDVGMLPPSCSTPSIRSGRRHSIAEINFNADTLLSKICPQTNSVSAQTKNTTLSSTVVGAGIKIDHPRLRQRRASMPHAIPRERDHSPLDLPKLKTINLQHERSKLAIEKDSKVNQNVKLGNFSRHVDGDLKWKRRNSLPNFDNFPTSKDSMAGKERLTARLAQCKPKPGSAAQRNATSSAKPSVFGRKYKKYPTPVTERSDEAGCEELDENESLGHASIVEENEPKENEELSSSEQELSFIPKATLQEKINKFFMEWVDGPDDEPRTDIEELLQEFRKKKEVKGLKQSNEVENDLEIDSEEQDVSGCTKDTLLEEGAT